jgi:tyrosinase
LSTDEVHALTNALNVLKSSGAYDDFVRRHFDARSVAHGGPLFLPWHRVFLEELESALRGVDSAIEALPYWPWEQNSGIGSLWTDDSFGPDGDSGHGNRVLSGPFASWQALILNTVTGQLEPRTTLGLVRNLSSPNSLPSQATVQNILAGDSAYPDARPDIETSPLHNAIHSWVGGDMTVMTSPNDPIFFLHHCNVDRLWWEWQLDNGLDNYQGPTDAMPFLQSSITPADVFDIVARGYTYA